MTTGQPPSEDDAMERDPALDRAWGEHSRETPPAALDRAILAAAHRAVGGGPTQAGRATESTRPQRWWMPLAAAATIGVVALGILQVVPPGIVEVVPQEQPAVARRSADAGVDAAKPDHASPAAPGNDAASRLQPSAPAARAIEERPAPATNSATGPRSPQLRSKVAVRKDAAESNRVPEPAGRTSREEARSAPQAASAQAERRESDGVTPPQQQQSATAAPQPFPAARPSGASDAAPVAREETTRQDRNREDKNQLDRSAEKSGTASEPASPRSPPPASSLAANIGQLEGKTASGAGSRDTQSLGNELRKVSPAAPAGSAAPAPPPRTNINDAEMPGLASQPDAWIARIRRLRAEGHDREALRELREFRRVVADAERRLPGDLREWLDSPRP